MRRKILKWKKTIVVNGKSSITVTPDIAYVEVGVITDEKTSELAQSKNAEKMKKVIDGLKELGIAKEDIQTVSYYLNPKYDWTNNKQVLVGYTAQNSVKVTVKDISKASKVIDIAGQNGSNSINGISYDSSKRNQIYLEALKKAAKETETKAASIASVFSSEKVKPVKLEEVKSYEYQPMMMKSAMMENTAADAATPVETGEIIITAEVIGTFEY